MRSKHSVKGQEQAVRGQDSPAECLKVDKIKDAIGEVKLLITNLRDIEGQNTMSKVKNRLPDVKTYQQSV